MVQYGDIVVQRGTIKGSTTTIEVPIRLLPRQQYLTIRMWGNPGAAVTIHVGRPCTAPGLSVVVGPGVVGSPPPGRAGANCGDLVRYGFSAATGYHNLRVRLNHVAAEPAGTIVIGGTVVLTATAEPKPIDPLTTRPFAAAVESFLSDTDKAAAFAAVLSELEPLEASFGARYVDAIRSVFQAVEADPIKRQQLEAAEALIGGEIVVPATSSTQAPLAGPSTTSSRRTVVTFVNGIWNDRAKAIAGYRELVKVVRETTLPNTAVGYAYNPTASIAGYYVQEVRCAMTALASLQPTFGVSGIVDLAWDYLSTCPLTPQEIPDVVEASRQLLGLPIRSSFPSNLAAAIHRMISAGDQLIMVPHSQGNLMLRDALTRYSTVTAADQAWLTSISLAPQGVPPSTKLRAFNCWMVEDDLFEFVGFNQCNDPVSPLATAKSAEHQFFVQQSRTVATAGCGSFALLTSCLAWNVTQDEIAFPDKIYLHNFIDSYLADESRALLKRLLQAHKNTLDAATPSGLVAFYPLDGTGADQSGNGNHGTFIGTVTPAPGRAGPGTALDFSGPAALVRVPTNPLLRSLTNDLTIVVWVRRGASPITAQMIPVSRRLGIPIHFELYSQPEGFGFQCCSTTSNVTGIFYHPIGNGLATLNDGQWHQVAVTRRFGPGGFTALYLDGAAVPAFYNSGSASDPAPVLDADLLIGRQDSPSPGQFTGLLDNLYIFNRILTPAEIQALQ